MEELLEKVSVGTGLRLSVPKSCYRKERHLTRESQHRRNLHLQYISWRLLQTQQ
jgi:hypothetical protein